MMPGSTTTKSRSYRRRWFIIISIYSGNNGSPLKTALKAMKDIYSKMPECARIVRSCSTGYGEALLKSALLLDEGEVETVAHYTVIRFFDLT